MERQVKATLPDQGQGRQALCISMSVACGHNFTLALTQIGEVWSFGSGDDGQLGLGDTGHRLKPAWVGGRDFFEHPVILVAGGMAHAACVTSKGVLYTWGNGENGVLGDGFLKMRLIPVQISSAMHGGQPAVMVSCGARHTLVLTEAGSVWTCGNGIFGKLGHGNEERQLTLKLVSMFEESGLEPGSAFQRMSMVAAGVDHSVALSSGGQVFTWGRAKNGCLGVTENSVVRRIFGEAHEIVIENKFVPTLVARSSVERNEWFGGGHAVMVAAGGYHTVVVIEGGRPWVWGKGSCGQLGLGDRDDFYAPQELPTNAFQEFQVLAAHCGIRNTVFLTGENMWTCGDNGCHVLGYSTNDFYGLVPRCIEQVHFKHKRIISAAIGSRHTVSVDQDGHLYSWGTAEWNLGEFQDHEILYTKILGAIGHPLIRGDNIKTPLRLHGFYGDKIGSYQHTVAFAMCTHARLGKKDNTLNFQYGQDGVCKWGEMPIDLVKKIIQACCIYPQGVMRLLGGDI